MNSSILKNYTEHCLSRTRDGCQKMLVANSYSSYYAEDAITLPKKNGETLGLIPGRIAQYIQILDVSVFSVDKAHYCVAVKEWIEVNGPKSTV